VAHRRVHRPPYEGVQALLDWARGAWAYIDGECLRHGVDLDDVARLPAPRILNLLQSYWLDEYSKYWYAGVEADIRGDTRDQIDVFMHKSNSRFYGDKANRPTNASPYLEPNEDGFYPGLEQAGRLDA
jgi:hypothetical protein